MKWIIVDQLKENSSIEKVEKIWNIKFPKNFIVIVEENNGASPEKDAFDSEVSKERVFNRLLNFNSDSKENILKTYEWIKDRLPKKVYPFANDSFGNYICFDYIKGDIPKIVFANYETGKTEKNFGIENVSDTFEEFLEKLY